MSGLATVGRRATRLAAALLALAGAGRTPPAAAQDGGRPNVLLVVVDDLGYGDLGSYGAADLRTPALDSLAAAGMRFTRFYANSSVCSPSRASLLTGRYPDLVGVPGVIRTHAADSWGYLSPGARLLPQLLRGAGYQTALVGKWHLGLEPPNLPTQRGFDHSFAFLGDMMDDYVHHRRWGINYLRRGEAEVAAEGHATDLFTDEAVGYIRSRGPGDAPFFLYLAYTAPHVPVQPPDSWVERVARRNPGIDPKRARLAAFVEHTDAAVGRVLSALRASGHAERTLVIFTSDNGGELGAGGRNGPLRGSKTEMYEGGIRVPTLVAWPGRVPAGAVSDRVLLGMDLFPTVAEAAGIAPDPTLDGRSFLAHLQGREAADAERTLVWVRQEGGREMGQPVYAVRRGDWKLVQNRPDSRFELFNLRDDPREQTDLAQTESRRFSELAAALRAHVQRAGRVPWQPPH